MRVNGRRILNPGRMTHQIRIEQNNPTRSSSGALVENWELFYECLAAKEVSGSRSGEFVRAHQVFAAMEALYIVRGPMAVTSKMRILDRTRPMDILAVLVPSGHQPSEADEIQLVCQERISVGS